GRVGHRHRPAGGQGGDRPPGGARRPPGHHRLLVRVGPRTDPLSQVRPLLPHAGRGRGLRRARPRDGGRRLVRAGTGPAADVVRQRAQAARPDPGRARRAGRGRTVTAARAPTRALPALALAVTLVAALTPAAPAQEAAPSLEVVLTGISTV